ncbi:uncharacterized protein LOC110924799 [Helianthus annuus]|uniref:uncharacterized protein LOC110924799 n=1 Tax=Helianthus annuus TaxID=4232 RepID=UPI000B8F411F|nr:uncharacterized protein LOC110924799 [Helianthus annuus]
MGAEAARVMTWDEFKVPFLKHHSPKAVINRIKEEFIQLRQKGETIDKITGIFMDKLRFCDELVTTEEQKIYYYYNMLSAEYREFMTPSKYETLTEIINTAREREIELKKQVERGERRAHDVNPSPTKKARTGESGKKVDAKGGSPNCKVCGKGHKGECRFKDKPCPICNKTGHTASLCPGKVSVCYNCYQPGHKKSECPDLVGKKDAKESPAEAPKAKARSFQLTAAEAKTEPDVVSVVGMDWLAQNHAKGGNPIVCSMMKAHKLMKRGCKAFMIYANEPKKESRKIEDVPVVRDFQDVFPEDLPGIPPEREVEFGIELIPGAKPVAKAPYRLAPSELQELMSQIQDLLDKGFIRPSVSPWGAPVLFVRKKDGSMRMYFSKIALPLTKLTQKKEKFIWGVDQERAFQTLKEKLTQAPVLTLPDGVEDMVVYSDASLSGSDAF